MIDLFVDSLALGNFEKEGMRNIEVMWLTRRICPDHNTISNFRRDNPKAIKKVFRVTVNIARNFELIGGNLFCFFSTTQLNSSEVKVMLNSPF